MINGVYGQQVNFSGKSFRAPKGFVSDCLELDRNFRREGTQQVFERPYFPIETNFNIIRLRKEPFGYAAPESKALELYSGPTGKHQGFSTESGGYGGGWIKSDINTPLSTRDIHTCAAVNLVNEATGQQILYHVYHSDTGDAVKDFLVKNFPNFNKVSIISGDQPRTQNTTNAILFAVKKLNKHAQIDLHHFPVEAPEVVAHNGKVYYLPAQKDGSMTFEEVVQYN